MPLPPPFLAMRPRLLRGLAAALAAAAAWAAAGEATGGDSAPVRAESLDFEKVGREVLTRNGFDPATVKPEDYHRLLDKSCATIALGPVVLQIPKEAFRQREGRGRSDGAGLDALRRSLPAALRAVAQIANWTGIPKEQRLEAKDFTDLAAKLELAKDFDPDALPSPWTLESLLGKDVDKRERAILDKVAALLALPAFAPPADAPARRVPLLVLPTRRDMIEFLCVAGVMDPFVKSAFHVPAITGWMHSYYGVPGPDGRVNILCLEEGHSGDGATERWTEPSQDTDAILVQHTLTYDALVALLAGMGPAVPNWLALGLAFQGVLEQYGNIAGRLGADSVGDVTPPRQAFVPGGQSNGGQFPPNLSALRGTIIPKELLRVLEDRKQAAYELLQERDAGDPQRKAAQSGDEVVFLNFRNAAGSEEDGYLHFGPYVGQDLSFLTTKDASTDLALTQRALFALIAAELAAREKGAALTRLLAALPGAGEDFNERFAQAVGVSPTELERAVFEPIKKK